MHKKICFSPSNQLNHRVNRSGLFKTQKSVTGNQVGNSFNRLGFEYSLFPTANVILGNLWVYRLMGISTPLIL